MRSECIWSESHGSGGFKASCESVKIWEQEDGTYRVKFSTPVSVTTLYEGDDFDRAREIAEDKWEQVSSRGLMI